MRCALTAPRSERGLSDIEDDIRNGRNVPESLTGSEAIVTDKQRDIVFQRWSSAFRREDRDLASLEQAGKRALADSDVRDDPTVQSLIRAELAQRRSELEQKLRSQASVSKPSEPRPTWRTELPETTHAVSPEQARDSFNRHVRSIAEFLERGDDTSTHATLAKMKDLQEQHPDVIPSAAIEAYGQRVAALRVHIQELTDGIAHLREEAVAASSAGNEQKLARSMQRLSAIHAAHPCRLEEAALDRIREDVAQACDERSRHRGTTKQLLERERAITAEIRTLAATVREFHRVACGVRETTDEFRNAEASFLRAIETARKYDTVWFSGVVLELADLLAEWTVPPLGAEGQIDRFLDGISKGLDRIHAEIRDIQRKRDPSGGVSSEAAAGGTGSA